MIKDCIFPLIFIWFVRKLETQYLNNLYETKQEELNFLCEQKKSYEESVIFFQGLLFIHLNLSRSHHLFRHNMNQRGQLEGVIFVIKERNSQRRGQTKVNYEECRCLMIRCYRRMMRCTTRLSRMMRGGLHCWEKILCKYQTELSGSSQGQ